MDVKIEKRRKKRKSEGHTKITLTIPLEPTLQIMVLSDHSQELVSKVIALTLSKTIDMLYMVTNSKDGLPSSDWVSADNWVFSGEFVADVEWVTAGFSVELEFLVFGGLGEEWLSVGGCESVEELLVGWRETVVDFVAGCPEGV